MAACASEVLPYNLTSSRLSIPKISLVVNGEKSRRYQRFEEAKIGSAHGGIHNEEGDGTIGSEFAQSLS